MLMCSGMVSLPDCGATPLLTVSGADMALNHALRSWMSAKASFRVRFGALTANTLGVSAGGVRMPPPTCGAALNITPGAERSIECVMLPQLSSQRSMLPSSSKRLMKHNRQGGCTRMRIRAGNEQTTLNGRAYRLSHVLVV